MESFDNNWKKRTETKYNHWEKHQPKNQVQYAFRNHWTTFEEIMRDENFNGGKRCLEVGCGRGSLSSYFCDNGYECTLLDISPTVIEAAKDIYRQNGHQADFVVGDAFHLPFPDNHFDIVFSIGLFEHFKDIAPLLLEQIRILDRGGVFFGYIVPEYTENIQKDYKWINDLLKGYVTMEHFSKEEVYRNTYDSTPYIKILEESGMRAIQASGIYPLPMISHSIDFPFSLMPEKSEIALLQYFESVMEKRKKDTAKNPWLCEEGYGQAFLVWAFKP